MNVKIGWIAHRRQLPQSTSHDSLPNFGHEPTFWPRIQWSLLPNLDSKWTSAAALAWDSSEMRMLVMPPGEPLNPAKLRSHFNEGPAPPTGITKGRKPWTFSLVRKYLSSKVHLVQNHVPQTPPGMAFMTDWSIWGYKDLATIWTTLDNSQVYFSSRAPCGVSQGCHSFASHFDFSLLSAQLCLLDVMLLSRLLRNLLIKMQLTPWYFLN